MFTRDQAQAAADAAVAERDTIQANLLDLDGSFGKRLLAGATLTGESRRRWEVASAGLASLWETFSAYSAVIDRAAELLAVGKVPPAKLAEVTDLLTGASVRLTRAAVPLSQRELTMGTQANVTLAAAVREMRTGFADVAAVLTAAETVWNKLADGLAEITSSLDEARRQLTEADDAELAAAVDQAGARVRELRDQLNSDPLALSRGGQVDTRQLDLIRADVATVAARASELATLRAQSGQRIAEVTAAVTAATTAWQDALQARERAAAKVVTSPPGPLPAIAGLTARAQGLAALAAQGRWARLDSELQATSRQAAALATACRDAEQAAVALLARRDELRGLLGAYRAKAAGLGAIEDSDLDGSYRRARELLWTAPCDLSAATAAVTSYQQAVLRLRQRGSQPGTCR